jgi:hypothetical protein
MAVTVTICPPAIASGAIFSSPTVKRKRAVRTPDRDEDGNFADGLSFDDYSRCQVRYHVAENRARCYQTPLWTQSTETIRIVLLEYFERRLFSGKKRATLQGDVRQRLVTAMSELKRRGTPLSKRRDTLAARLSFCSSHKRRKDIEKAIDGVDRQLQLSTRPDVVLQIILDYHGAHLDSIEIADRYEVTPKFVHELLSRMNKVAQSLGYAVEPSISALGRSVEESKSHESAPHQASTKSRYRLEGLCVHCGFERDSEKLTCSTCLKHIREREANLQERNVGAGIPAVTKTASNRRLKGLCPSCGEARDSEKLTCSACRKRRQEYRGSLCREWKAARLSVYSDGSFALNDGSLVGAAGSLNLQALRAGVASFAGRRRIIRKNRSRRADQN